MAATKPNLRRWWIAATAVGVVAAAVLIIGIGSRHTGSKAEIAPDASSSSSVGTQPGGALASPGASGPSVTTSSSTPAPSSVTSASTPATGTPTTARAEVTITVPALTPTSGTLADPIVTIVGGDETLNCKTAPVTCDPQSGDDLRIAIQSRPWKSIQSVCLTFRFKGDLVDPGEQLQWTNAGGFDGGSSPVAKRQSCATPAGQQKVTDSLRDGYQVFDVWMESGSAHVDGISVAITGAYA
jgi:hypothetical protein